MKIYNILIAFLIIVATPLFTFAQDTEEKVKEIPLRERIYVGGNIGLQIGNLTTSVIISPTVGFRVTNRLTSGLGLTYQYYRNRGWGNLSGFTSVTHIYGGSIYSRYSITRQIFVHTEYEALNLDSQMNWQVTPGERGRFWEQNYFLGGGYRTQIGSRAFLNIMLLYNFNNNSVVHFQNPIFRFGLDVRL